MNRYFGKWSSIVSVWQDFEFEPDVKDEEILFAAYCTEPYEGTAEVLFERDGQLFEVQASHCSCHGLQDWKPALVTWEALALRDYTEVPYGLDTSARAAMSEIVRAAIAKGKAP